MNINLKKYQETALNDLIYHTSYFLDRNGKGEVIVFQAPTGSGKTIVMAKYVEDLIKERNKEDLCFIWLSIGKGELHIQSKKSLENVFGGSPKVSLVEAEFNGSRSYINRNEVVVASWNKLWSKDSDTGEWKVLLMKDGEKINFREVLAETQKRRKIILIIDESAIGYGTARTEEIRVLIGADVIIEVSATPKAISGNAHIKIEPNDVIEAGMIKKELIINDGIADISKNENDSQELVLKSAFAKRKELKKLFEEIKTDINPLVLIQIPNSEAGDAKLESIQAFLAKNDITVDNGKLAIWLSDKKTENIENISDLDDKTEFLIFKQAIDTGWDCPRAHILVKLRESSSEIFEIQVVGRILRMPERKHYDNEKLNTGYIYSNVESITVKPDEYKLNIINRLPSQRIDSYKDIELPSYYKTRADYGDIKANFYDTFMEKANEYFGIKKGSVVDNGKLVEKMGLSLDLTKYSQKIMADTGIETKDFDLLKGEIKGDDFAKLSASSDEIENKYYSFLKENLGSFSNIKRSVPIVSSVIYQWFEEYLGFNLKKQSVFIQSILINDDNQKHFRKILSDSIDGYKNIKDEEIKKRLVEGEQFYNFDIPTDEYFNENISEKVERVPHYATRPCYLDKERSDPEKAFENFVEENSNKIIWWWKNGENKNDYFGIKYLINKDIHTFYPDYLVQFKDGGLGIFETKDQSDNEGLTVTKAKAERLYQYIKEQKRKDLYGGIIVKKGNQLLFNDLANYNWDKVKNSDWSEWKPLSF